MIDDHHNIFYFRHTCIFFSLSNFLFIHWRLKRINFCPPPRLYWEQEERLIPADRSSSTQYFSTMVRILMNNIDAADCRHCLLKSDFFSVLGSYRGLFNHCGFVVLLSRMYFATIFMLRQRQTVYSTTKCDFGTQAVGRSSDFLHWFVLGLSIWSSESTSGVDIKPYG